VSPVTHALDVFESPFHRWPVISRRDRGRAGTSAVRLLEIELAAERAERLRVERELESFRTTRSWRWTAPFRLAMQGLGTGRTSGEV
jgi:hypothetical protein